MALAILALFASSGFGSIFPLLIVRLLDTVTQARDAGVPNLLAALLVGIFLLAAIMWYGGREVMPERCSRWSAPAAWAKARCST